MRKTVVGFSALRPLCVSVTFGIRSASSLECIPSSGKIGAPRPVLSDTEPKPARLHSLLPNARLAPPERAQLPCAGTARQRQARRSPLDSPTPKPAKECRESSQPIRRPRHPTRKQHRWNWRAIAEGVSASRLLRRRIQADPQAAPIPRNLAHRLDGWKMAVTYAHVAIFCPARDIRQ